MTLAQIIATCPNWRQLLKPAARPARRARTSVVPLAPYDYAADWARRKAKGLSARRMEQKRRNNRASYARHRDEILDKLKKRRARSLHKNARALNAALP